MKTCKRLQQAVWMIWDVLVSSVFLIDESRCEEPLFLCNLVLADLT